MTYAPQELLDLRAFLRPKTGLAAGNLGIVGDARHIRLAYSYHLGKDQLSANAYSRQTARDRVGLTNAASAMDIGRFPRLRQLSVWLVAQARANKPGTSDIREIIYSPDGVRVLRWDRERGVTSLPRTGEANSSHLWHTHISYYRDSEKRDKTAVFRPFWISWGADIPATFKTAYSASAVANKLRAVGITNYGDAINLIDIEAGCRKRGINFATSIQLIDLRAFMAPGIG